MCLSPILLRNKYNYPRSFRTTEGVVSLPNDGRLYHRVPCGKCPQCIQQKQDGYYLRCRNEYLHCDKRALFVTNTYSDEHLPYYSYSLPPIFAPGYLMQDSDLFTSMPVSYHDSVYHGFLRPVDGDVLEDVRHYNIPMWDKTHIQKYLKSLNEKIIYRVGVKRGLTRLGADGKVTVEWKEFLNDFKRPLKYLVVCERGKADIYIDDKGHQRVGTARPHYHTALFLQTDEFSLDELKCLCVDSWRYGRTYPLVIENKTGYARSPYQALRYVCKYISKCESVDYHGISPDIMLWRSNEDKLRYKPFTLVSNFLGISYLDNCDVDYLVNQVIPNGVSDVSASGTRSINLPSYYINKLRYNQSKSLEHHHNADTRCLVNEIYPNLDNLVPSLRYDEIWDHSYGYPQFVGYEYHPTKPNKRVNYASPYYFKISQNLTHLKASYYESLLLHLHFNPSLLEYCYNNSKDLLKLWPKSAYPPFKDFLDFFESLYPADTSSFYLFVCDELDIDLEHPYHTLYYILQCVKTFYSLKRIDEHNYKYLCNLNKALNKSPELFNVNPYE